MLPPPSTIILTAVLAGLATAKPASKPKSKNGIYSVTQVANTNFQPHGPSQRSKTLAKYGVSVPFPVRASGNATATPEKNDIQYLTPVQLGTPPQTLNLDLDSGSSDLWVFSTATAPSDVAGQTLYSPSDSATASRVAGAKWKITYGDRSSSEGLVYHDVVGVGGVEVGKQGVQAATLVSDQFTRDQDGDGILGLAFSRINTVRPNREKTWFDNVASLLDKRIWTADLKFGDVGTYTFGTIDKTRYTGAITYVDVDAKGGFWMFNITGYAVGNSTFSHTSFRGIADTGTTLAMLPKAVVKTYYDAVPQARNEPSLGGYVFPCQAKLPNFVLGVGKSRITVPGKFVNYAPADALGVMCYGGIQSDAGIGFSVIGDVVLKAAFVVFDAQVAEAPRLGWAAKKL